MAAVHSVHSSDDDDEGRPPHDDRQVLIAPDLCTVTA
jgi:hypothetical protein